MLIIEISEGKNEFIPAIRNGDKEKANEILTKLGKFYSEHRTNI